MDKVLSKIPSFTMMDDDYWGYHCKAFCDVVEITYFELVDGDEKRIETFSVPTCCAEQLFTGLASIAREADALNCSNN